MLIFLEEKTTCVVVWHLNEHPVNCQRVREKVSCRHSSKFNIPEMYKSIGDTLKKNYSGAEAWFLTSHMDGLKHVGLRASRKIEIYQAKLECRFVKYEMYQGSKKMKYKQV